MTGSPEQRRLGPERREIWVALVGGPTCEIWCLGYDHWGTEYNVALKEMTFEDDDRKERYMACAWRGKLVLVGGEKGIMKALDVESRRMACAMRGHTGAIQAIEVCAASPNLCASASADRSIRLWDIDNGVQLAVLGGLTVHPHTISCLAFCDHGRWLASGGMQNGSLAIWDLENLTSMPAGHNGAPVLLLSPHCNTKTFEKPGVDHMEFIGDSLLVSSNGNLRLWTMGEASRTERGRCKIQPLKRLLGPPALREQSSGSFSLSFNLDLVACGSKRGRIYLLDVHNLDSERVSQVLPLRGCRPRQCEFGLDDLVLLVLGDDGSVWRFDWTPPSGC